MNRRMFLASMAGFAAASGMTSAASTARSTLVTLPTVEQTTPLPEWDYTAEDFDAFLTRTTDAHDRRAWPWPPDAWDNDAASGRDGCCNSDSSRDFSHFAASVRSPDTRRPRP
ncbi:MAG: hypothetical protein MUC36_10270 [Planctomycetes bacterium]|jgi:hypothetical protein|nr:hypothetical protein [Planctomycetota bacterium]